MNLLDRLDSLMAANGEKPADLAKNAGIPATTIYGLYNKGYKNAKITTIIKICDYYGVTLDYLIKGSSGISNDALILAAKYDRLDKHSRELVELVINHEAKRVRQESGHESPSVREALGEPSESQAVHPDRAQGE